MTRLRITVQLRGQLLSELKSTQGWNGMTRECRGTHITLRVRGSLCLRAESVQSNEVGNRLSDEFDQCAVIHVGHSDSTGSGYWFGPILSNK